MAAKFKKFLEEQGLDGFLILGDGLCDADMYYLSSFFAPDRFALLATAEGITILVSGMELGRARLESNADRVVSTSDYDIMAKIRELGRPEDAYQAVLSEFLKDNEVRLLGVPMRFPAGTYRALGDNFQVSIIESPVSSWRAVKSDAEIAAIESTQRSCEEALSVALNLISGSKLRGGVLYSGGCPLTSEKVRSTIEIALLERDCEAVDTIVAGGVQAANPHARGSGPLYANAPIVLDIFPRSKTSRYFADMTRTVLKGRASQEILDMYDAVLAAQQAGLEAVRAGVSGSEVHSRVGDVFNDRGYKEREGQGFTHSTGHGVGLDVHERPSLGFAKDILQARNVVTVEPGLYYPEIGGVRIEDLVVVTEIGCRNLTVFDKNLVL